MNTKSLINKTNMLNVLILDDEPKAIESLKWELANFCEDINIVATFTNPYDAQKYLQHENVDCVFLDIEMPQMDGFAFLDSLTFRDFAVIITTAYDQYALHAIKERALDYLLKPIDSDDLVEAVKRVENFKRDSLIKDRFEEVLLNLTANSSSASKKIGLAYDGKIVFLDPDEILYCESDGNYTSIYLESGEKLFITQTLKKIEDKLPEHEFYRIHNSYVINLNKVREYLKNDGYIVLINNKKIPVSRHKKNTFLDKI